MYTPRDKSAVAVDTGIKKAAGDPKTVKDHYKAMQVLGLGQTTSDGEVKVDTNNDSTLVDNIFYVPNVNKYCEEDIQEAYARKVEASGNKDKETTCLNLEAGTFTS